MFDEMIGRISAWVFMFHDFIANPHSPPLYSIPQRINTLTYLPSFFGMIYRERRNEVMIFHLSPYHAAARKLEGEQKVYGTPGTRVRLTTPPLQNAKKGSK